MNTPYHADAHHEAAEIIINYYCAGFKKAIKHCKQMIRIMQRTRTVPMVLLDPVLFQHVNLTMCFYIDIKKIIKQIRDGNK